jgi:hypothetical protein
VEYEMRKRDRQMEGEREKAGERKIERWKDKKGRWRKKSGR